MEIENRLQAIATLIFITSFVIFVIGLEIKSLWCCVPFLSFMVMLGICAMIATIQMIWKGDSME